MSEAESKEAYAVDERLVAPETRFEIVGGQVHYVSPSKEPHAVRHSKIQALLEAVVGPEHVVACDMLTRAAATSDFAPDASVFPATRASGGGRQLEELAFEVVSTETLGHAGEKAAGLVGRGVRRVFAIDVKRNRALEWSRSTDTWEILASDAIITDPALAAPLSVADLVSASKADDAVARALLAKENPVLTAALREVEHRGEERGEKRGVLYGEIATLRRAIIDVLIHRRVAFDESLRASIDGVSDPDVLRGLLSVAVTCRDATELSRALRQA